MLSKESPESENHNSTTSTHTTSDINTESEAGVDEQIKTEPVHYDWSGPNDPDHPHNWPFWHKIWVSVLLTMFVLIVSIASSIFGSGSKVFEKEFVVGSEVTVLGTSLFLLVC